MSAVTGVRNDKDVHGNDAGREPDDECHPARQAPLP